MRKMIVMAVLAAAVAGCSAAGGGGARALHDSGSVQWSGQEASGGAGRSVKLFDDGWTFRSGESSCAETLSVAAPWPKVNVPHDWSIAGPFDAKWASGQAYLPGGIGWYRKEFDVAALKGGERLVLRFNGVYDKSEIWVNGQKVGGRPFGFMTVSYDITPFVKAGPNVVAVGVDHSEFADSRWYTGSGIFRHVYLTQEPAVHVADNGGVFVHTAGDVAMVDVTLEGGEARVVNIVRDAAGKEVARAEGRHAELSVASPAKWSPEHPLMYTLETQVVVGNKPTDVVRTPFGFRDVKFTPDKGLFVNGESVKMKGVCLHEDAGVLGSAIPVEVWERRLRILKSLGCNAIRTSHNPPAPEFLDLCDKLGFLVMDEAFDEWDKGKKKWVDQWNGKRFSTDGYHEFFAQWADQDLQDMVRRDRNHPSVIMWSIGNEIDYPNDPYPPNDPHLLAVAQRLARDVKAVDTTRPVTAACAAVPTNLFWPALDIVGYNYQEQLYAADHAKDPSRVIYGSENKHDARAWAAVRDNDFVSGQFLWTGIDYLGEAHAYPNHTSASGLLDEAGFMTRRATARAEMWGGTGDRPTAQDSAARLEVREYPTTLGPGDGKHVAQLEVAAVNASGVLVPDKTPITVAVTGAARFLGIENGDTNDVGDYHAATRALRGGRAIVYVEVTGPAEVRVQRAGGEPVVLKLATPKPQPSPH